MEDYIKITAVPIVVTVIYWIINLLKMTEIVKEKNYKMIPLIAVGVGVLFSIISYYFAPQILPVDNLFMAILMGGASGLAATGTHQIFKQLSKGDGKVADNENSVVGSDNTQDNTNTDKKTDTEDKIATDKNEDK